MRSIAWKQGQDYLACPVHPEHLTGRVWLILHDGLLSLSYGGPYFSNVHWSPARTNSLQSLLMVMSSPASGSGSALAAAAPGDLAERRPWEPAHGVLRADPSTWK